MSQNKLPKFSNWVQKVFSLTLIPSDFTSFGIKVKTWTRWLPAKEKKNCKFPQSWIGFQIWIFKLPVFEWVLKEVWDISSSLLRDSKLISHQFLGKNLFTFFWFFKSSKISQKWELLRDIRKTPFSFCYCLQAFNRASKSFFYNQSFFFVKMKDSLFQTKFANHLNSLQNIVFDTKYFTEHTMMRTPQAEEDRSISSE